jgi:hypothetical protein
MSKNNRNNISEVLIKFAAPRELKEERNISLSALLRLIKPRSTMSSCLLWLVLPLFG